MSVLLFAIPSLQTLIRWKFPVYALTRNFVVLSRAWVRISLQTLLHPLSQTRLAHGFAAVSVVFKRLKQQPPTEALILGHDFKEPSASRTP